VRRWIANVQGIGSLGVAVHVGRIDVKLPRIFLRYSQSQGILEHLVGESAPQEYRDMRVHGRCGMVEIGDAVRGFSLSHTLATLSAEM